MRRKKVLALVLTLALALSVAAGAAFTDQKQIKNTEAVDMCVALNIISGYPDGSYKPGGNITRAEFTKMLCVLLNGGNTPATATKATPTFSDIRTSANASWAEGFIEYCYAKGIVSGVGGGKFNPNGNVTATEAAKMLLVALGYNADVENYTGAAWALKVNVQANQDGLYKDLEKIDTNAALTRDNAAQMVWNALQAYVIDKSSSIDRTDGSVTDIYTKSTTVDLLAKMYKGDIFEGTLTGFTYDSNKDKWTYVVTAKDKDDVKVTSKTDYTALLNQNVKAVYDKTGKQPYDAYGIFAVDSDVILTGVFGDLPTIKTGDTSFKIDGVKYTLDGAANGIEVKLFNTKTTVKLDAVAAADKYDAQKFTAIDQDGDGDIDYFMVVPFAFAKVTYVNSDKFNFTVKADPFSVMGTVKSYDFDDVNAYDKLAKNDYVVITAKEFTSDKTASIVKAQMLSGKITSTKDGDTAKIDGTWYTFDALYDGTIANDCKAGTTLTDAAVVNGYIFASDATNQKSISDYAVVVSIVSSSQNGLSGNQAKLLFSDGSKVVVDLAKDYAAQTNGGIAKGDLVTYTKNADNEYKLADAITATDPGFDKHEGVTSTSKLSNSSDKLGYLNGYAIKDDSVIFVAYKNGSYKVITGQQLMKMNKSDVDVSYGKDYVLATKTGNTYNVDMAYVSLGAKDVSDADTYYGYITAIEGIENKDGDVVSSLTMWTANGEVTYQYASEDIDGANVPNRVKVGNVIEYKLNSDKEISEILVGYDVDGYTTIGTQGDDSFATIGISALAPTFQFQLPGSKTVQLTTNGKYFELTKDTEYIYIENSDEVGAQKVDLSVADDAEKADCLIANAFIVFDGTNGEIALVVYDVDNDINK